MQICCTQSESRSWYTSLLMLPYTTVSVRSPTALFRNATMSRAAGYLNTAGDASGVDTIFGLIKAEIGESLRF